MSSNDRIWDILINVITEIIGILITVFIVDRLIKRREIERESTFKKPIIDLILFNLLWIYTFAIKCIISYQNHESYKKIIFENNLQEKVQNKPLLYALIDEPMELPLQEIFNSSFDLLRHWMEKIFKLMEDFEKIIDEEIFMSCFKIRQRIDDIVFPGDGKFHHSFLDSNISEIIQTLSIIIKIIDDVWFSYGKTLDDFNDDFKKYKITVYM